MRPPECCICDNSLENGDKCELVSFAMIPQEVIDQKQNSNPAGLTIPDHPEHQEWFCMDHIDMAKQFEHLTSREAVTQLKAILVPPPGRNLKGPVLDDLFVSECPLCGDWAGWTGIIELEKSYETSDRNSITTPVHRGALMHCPHCANRFMDIPGALRSFFEETPPLFIPGRRLTRRLEGGYTSKKAWPVNSDSR